MKKSSRGAEKSKSKGCAVILGCFVILQIIVVVLTCLQTRIKVVEMELILLTAFFVLISAKAIKGR